MAIVAISAHLDDAALSASVRLSGGDATVLSVFTGMPPSWVQLSYWDRLTGATSSAVRQAERITEDAQAMRLLDAQGRHLDEPESQFRRGDPDLDQLAARMTEQFAGADEVWIPSAIGGHPDHRFARNAALRAAAATGHDEIVLYADFPYVIFYGWPSWVCGVPAGPCLDPDFWLADQLRAVGIDAGALTPEVVVLTPQQRDLKARIAAAYRSQAAALRLTPTDLAADPGKLGFELSWRTRLEAVGR